jgi:DNA-binding HxlR family transcriptional regulator
LVKAGRTSQVKDKKVSPFHLLFSKGVAESLLFLATNGSARYSEIKRQGYVVGDRSLSRLLKELQSLGLVERKVLSTFPVSTEYSLTERGQRLARHLKELKTLLESWF